jgi:hypothetical protein
MKTVLIAAALALLPLPAIAEFWQPTAFLSDGSTVSIDIDNVKRSPRDYNRISFRVQVNGMNGTSTGRIAGNCQSGSWRLSSGANNQGTAFTLAKDTGDQLLRSACVAPVNMGR